MYVIEKTDKQKVPIKVHSVSREIVQAPFDPEVVTWFLIWTGNMWEWVNAADYKYAYMD